MLSNRTIKKFWILLHDDKLNIFIFQTLYSYIEKYFTFLIYKFPIKTSKFYFWNSRFLDLNYFIEDYLSKILVDNHNINHSILQKGRTKTSNISNDNSSYKSVNIQLLKFQLQETYYSTYQQRSHLRNFYLSNSVKFNRNYIDFLRIALESNNLDILLDHANSRRNNVLKFNSSISEIFSYVHYLSGDRDKAKVIRSKLHRDSKKLRPNYFLDKSILVIGPAPIDNFELLNIDDFDLIVSANISDNYLPTGLRNRMSYFNSHFLHHEKSNLCNVAMDLSALMFKSYDDVLHAYSIINAEDRSKCWTIHSLDNLYFSPCYPMPTALQNILYDLTWIYPRKIHVVGFDLYATPSKYIYSKNYWFANQKPNLNDYSFRMHDLLSNFNFTKNLYAAKLFTADSKLINILQMSEEEYSVTLDKFHLGY